jgi:hypothetical protein
VRRLPITTADGALWHPSNSNSTRRSEKKHKSRKSTVAKEARLTTKVKRQKGLCWFCNEKMGYDCTREHLLARARGGTDDPANIRAAHGDCNSAAGHLPVKWKYELRKIGHAAGRLAVLEAAHRMRRHETYQAFTEQLEGSAGRLKAVTADGEAIATFVRVSAAEKARRRREASQQVEDARIRKEARKGYWAKLGLLQKPDWWDG